MNYPARSKYDLPGRARRYAEDRRPRRARAETRLMVRALDAIGGAPASALDAPCGTGRIAELLLERGIPTRGADLSLAMREETERRLSGRAGWGGVESLDLEDPTPSPDLAADLVVTFRFLPHLPDAAARARVLRCLRQLVQKDLLLSFHHPCSFHNLERWAKRLLGRGRADRYTLTLRRLRAEAAEAGFRVVRTHALARWRRELWLAHLVPTDGGAP